MNKDVKLDKEYYTVPEAAKILGLSPWTLRNYIYTNRIESEKILTSRVLRREVVAKEIHNRGRWNDKRR